MEAAAEGLWGLSENFEKKGEFAKSIKCLEAICQSNVSFLPIVEVKTRIRIAAMLLRHTLNVNQAKYHLERSQLLLKSIHVLDEEDGARRREKPEEGEGGGSRARRFV